MLLCGELERAEVKMESIHTSLLLCSNKNGEQVKSCGITRFFSTSILAIENSKVTLTDRKKDLYSSQISVVYTNQYLLAVLIQNFQMNLSNTFSVRSDESSRVILLNM